MFVNSMRLAVLFLLPVALSMKADGDAPHMALAVAASKVDLVSEMESVFARSEETHRRSMDEIAKGLTFSKAMETVQQSNLPTASSALTKVTNLLSGSQNLRSSSKDDGFGGLDGARRLLNSMIHEAMTKYDAEIAKCTDYYAKQCALMEIARGQISAANFIAASSRGLILDAQGVINQMEKDIPATKKELKDHNSKCKSELHKMDERLKVLMGDIAVMTMILKMSDCDAKGFVQMQKLAMLRCQNQCSHKDVVTFNHNELQSQVDKLQSTMSKDLMAETFADMFEGSESDDSVEFVQVDGSEYQAVVNKTKTKFNNPPVPRTKVPSNPCTDPNKGAPSAEDKRAAKCTLKKSPRCYKLQGRFLQIQAGIADDRDKLMEEIEAADSSCKDTKKTLQASIEADSSLLSSSQTKLAAATEKEASAGTKGRQVAQENKGYNDDLLKQMKICSQNYIDFETELCALKKFGVMFSKR